MVKVMKMSLTKKLAFGFILTVIVSIAIVAIISNIMINFRFNEYLISQQKTKINNVCKMAEDLYNKDNGFSGTSTDEIKRYASMEDFFIEIKDANGNIIFNNNKVDNNMDYMMKSMMERKMGNYVEIKNNLMKDNKKIGSIVIGYFDKSYINSDALNFKTTLNQSFMFSSLIALFIGFLVSFIFSKQISKPLIVINNVANKIRSGDLNARCKIKSSTNEIIELSESMNYLGDTLKKQEMLRKRSTADIAHELRTPLSTLKTHIEAMLDGIWDPTKERLESFYEEIERLIKLVNNLRNLSKLEEVNLNLSRSKFNVKDLVTSIIKNMEPIYNKKNYKLIMGNTIDLEVFWDRDKIIQIMDNLLSNAYKYLEANGVVKIDMKREKNNIIIEVEDNGIGIPEKDLPYIFERFYRSDKSRSRNTGGSGIGLAITKALVEAHDGKIEVYSEEGKGTKFVIKMPFMKYSSIL